LAEITAPELDHQIASPGDADPEPYDLAADAGKPRPCRRHQWADSKLEAGMAHPSTGRQRRLTLAAQEAAVRVAQSNIAAQEAQIQALEQSKAYQRVVAPTASSPTQHRQRQPSAVPIDFHVHADAP
jgi:hypothetical protein